MTPLPGTVRYDSLSSFDIANEMQAHRAGVRVVAFDLDGTLAQEHPDLTLGQPIPHMTENLIAEHEAGSYIVIYTTRLNQRLWGTQEVKLHQHLIYDRVSTSRILRQEFPDLKTRLPTLWTRSYYCESIGHISEKTVSRYIEEQKNR